VENKFMGDFNRGGNRGGGFRGGNDRGGRPNFQKRSFGGDRGGDRERPDMHKATCSECTKICEVPFRPSNDKPVYCNDCFSSKREGVDRKPRGDFGDRAPRREFDRPAQRPEIARVQPANDEMKNQLRDLNSKMDRLVTLMEKMTNTSAPKVVTAPVTKVAPIVAKTAEVKKVVASKPVAKVVAKKVVTKAKVVAKKPVAKKKK
jgi:CxxC-x17-CxxC domain-containing protein